MLVSLIKKLVKKLPIAFTKNQQYDRLTKKIIRQQCSTTANCIDIGAHEGEVFDYFLQYAPQGQHYAFEPIPMLYDRLVEKYDHCDQCHIYPVALSNTQGIIPFNYVVSNPAYSGIRKRNYDRQGEKEISINVQTDRLDHIIPSGISIQFLKIDVEGGELDVLKGAERILQEHHPLVVFEFGLGGSDLYGTTPEKMFSFFETFQYKLSLLQSFADHKSPMTREEFYDQFHNRKNYYFIAH